MEWYKNIMHRMISEYFSKQLNSSRVNCNIDDMWSALEKIFQLEDEIPLETIIGVIQSTKNLLISNNRLTCGDVSRRVLGYGIIFAKTACDSDIQVEDFAKYHPVKNINTLKKYERGSLIQLQHQTVINSSFLKKFELTFNAYADESDRLALLKRLDNFFDKLDLDNMYSHILKEVNHMKELPVEPESVVMGSF